MSRHACFRVWGIIILFSVLTLGTSSCASKNPVTESDVNKAPYKLELVTWKWYESSDLFVVVEGKVKNVSREDFDEVTAVVSFYDKYGNLLKNEREKIKYDPLRPGKTSPFRVVATFHPKATTARVDFQDFMGEFLSTNKKGQPEQQAISSK
ncbi:MAG: hypothetical protein GXX09_01775 [Syntrophomonadaceae bacterium]|nr:hypothetical protein [Syntrophomonadaceae bacterium]